MPKLKRKAQTRAKLEHMSPISELARPLAAAYETKVVTRSNLRSIAKKTSMMTNE